MSLLDARVDPRRARVPRRRPCRRSRRLKVDGSAHAENARSGRSKRSEQGQSRRTLPAEAAETRAFPAFRTATPSFVNGRGAAWMDSLDLTRISDDGAGSDARVRPLLKPQQPPASDRHAHQATSVPPVGVLRARSRIVAMISRGRPLGRGARPDCAPSLRCITGRAIADRRSAAQHRKRPDAGESVCTRLRLRRPLGILPA
jgi:hypothetical protein